MLPEDYERQDIEVLNEVRPYCFESDREEQWFKVGLQYGLDAADKEPLIHWISVNDDLPCNHKEMIINADSLNPTTKKVLVYNKNKEIRVAWMLYRKDKGWVWDITAYSQPLFFMFIPELPKE